jgi:phage terminase large subunit GpA-like protein
MSNFDKIKRNYSTGGESLSGKEYTRIRTARKRRDYYRRINEEKLEKLRQCKNVVTDWEDLSPAGFKWWSGVFEVLTPPPDMTVDEWADKYRRIPPEFAAEPGDWNTARVSCMRPIMRACSPSHFCRRVVLVKPVQSGGTEAAILNTIGHTIDINPRSILVVFPTLDLAESFSKERLDPMFRMVSRLNDKVAEVMHGANLADRSSVKKKRYPGGFMNLVGANSTSGLSSRPVPIAIMDEVDDCIRNAGQAGNPTRLLSARTTTFPDKKEIFISSPSNDAEETGIIQMWEDSTQGWLETQCPNENCNHWQVLEFERMDLETATLACEKCGQYFPQWKWNRGEKFERYRYDNPTHNSTEGFRMSGLNSPWLDWQIDIVDDYKEAKRIADLGDESLMRVFVNSKLVKSYESTGRKIDIDLYHERREIYECHSKGVEIPDGVVILTAAVDVQDTWLAYDITGWGRARESWGIETGEFQGDPHILPDARYPGRSVWDQIDKFVYRRVFRFLNGQNIRIRLVFVDSGGHCTTEVYKYCKTRYPRVFAIKGFGGIGKPIIIGGRIKEKGEGCWLLRLGVDTLKDEFHSHLNIISPGPGYCHWPMEVNGQDCMGYGEDYFEQLVAERRTIKYTKEGFARYQWHKNRTDPNEALDLRCYSRAALEYLKVRLEQIPRDVVKDSKTIERLDIGLGRSIMIEKANENRTRSQSSYQSRQSQSVMEGTGDDMSPEGDRKRATGNVSKQYGAVSNSF